MSLFSTLLKVFGRGKTCKTCDGKKLAGKPCPACTPKIKKEMGDNPKRYGLENKKDAQDQFRKYE
jgi:hypothetical protein